MEKKFYLTVEERATLKDRIERGIAASMTESDVIRAIQIAVEGTYSSKLDCYVGPADDPEIARLVQIEGINAESSIKAICEFADRIIEMVGRTNDPDNWVD